MNVKKVNQNVPKNLKKCKKDISTEKMPKIQKSTRNSKKRGTLKRRK